MTDPFAEHRSLLFTVAYEILGSAADAEDAVQDAWLRWSKDDRSQVRDPKAYAVRIVTRVALNRARTVSRRREDYVGPWLPEPILTAADAADDILLAESVSLAMLVVLDELGPVERAVFVLREVFDFDYPQIATMVDKSVASVRQIAHRARTQVRDKQPARAGAEADEATRRFVAAANSGDVTDLLELISPDVVLVTDGGGIRKAALRPIVGVEKVMRFLLAVQPGPDVPMQVTVARINGGPAALVRIDGELDSVITLELADGLVTRMLVQRNPMKLSSIDQVRPLAR